MSSRSKNKLLIMLHGIFRRAQTVYGLQANPLARIEKHPQRVSGDIEVFGPEEVWALGAYIRDLPGVVALGTTREETADRIREALDAYSDDLHERSQSLPAPRHIADVISA